MTTPALKRGWLGARFCVGCVCRLICWTLWLALSLILAFQIWIATSHELAVPGFVLRMLEERLAASNVRVTFGHARFDPAGRILIQNLRLSLPAYAEPVATADAAYVEFDPWALLGGKLDPHRLHVTGVNLAVPAMLSRSGQAEDIVRDLDATVRLDENDLIIEHLTSRVAGVAVVARGGIHLARRSTAESAPLPIPQYLSQHYAEICRQLIRVADRLAALKQPQLDVDLEPSNTRGALATVTVIADALKVETPYAFEAQGIRLSTRFPLQGDAPVNAPLNLELNTLQLRGGISLRHVSARVRGTLLPAQYTFDPRDVRISAAEISTQGFTFTELSARLQAGPLPRLKVELVAAFAGLPLAAGGEVNLDKETAAVQFAGLVSPTVLAPIGHAMHRDLSPYIGFGAPVDLNLRANFGDGWRFQGLAGQFTAHDIDAYHVHLDEGGGEFEFDGVRFIAHRAYAKLGGNFARGSFEQDFSNLQFRFLLEGRLRPLAIQGWFGRWWPDFFDDFEFPLAPPDASVDVAGRWKQGWLTTVFVYANSSEPVIHGVKFDHMRTLLFIRPNFFDGLELFTTRGTGAARGTFARQIEPGTYALVGMDLDFESTLPLDIPGRIFGAGVVSQLTSFRFANPPAVKLRGRFDGPASPDGVHQWLRLQAQSTGDFAFNEFPLSNLVFKASIHDDEIMIDDVTVNFAGGVVTGKARVWGREEQRRLGFDLALRDGSFAQAVRVLEEFTAKVRGVPAPPPGKFVQDRADVKLDLAASAEGLYTNTYTYHGEGHASLEGASLGEVHMLGLLSDLLPFTSLRFTAARANFKIEGPRLVFSEISATGANSAIDAHGNVDVQRRELDFKARVSPFRESKFLPSILIGAVLSPFTSVLEVKLTGTVDKPEWSFVNGPTNFLRNLTKPNPPPPQIVAPPVQKTPTDYLRR